jgi:hypothetical protein
MPAIGKFGCRLDLSTVRRHPEPTRQEVMCIQNRTGRIRIQVVVVLRDFVVVIDLEVP